MTPEGKVKAAVRKYLRSIDAWYYMPVQSGLGVVGIPDFIVCLRGRFLAIETKAPGKIKNTTANQDARLEEIHQAGGRALVCDDVQQVRTWVEGMR